MKLSLRRQHQIFLGLFFAVLFLPLAQMISGAVALPPLNENRALAPPPLPGDVAKPVTFFEETRAWFQDHYGFRALLIRIKAQLDYALFGFSDRIYIGQDGWLFFRNVIDHEDPEVENLTDAQLDRIVQNFAALRDRLAQKDVQLVVMTNQLKPKFYPEYLPPEAGKALGFHRFDAFRARMHKLDGVIYIDTTDRLLELKKTMQIFYKTDFHWTNPAAFDAAQSLVDNLAAQQKHGPLWSYAMQIGMAPYSGGQATFMPLFKPMQEIAPMLVVQGQRPQLFCGREGPFESISWQANKKNLLPPTVMYGDSFADGIFNAGFRDYFQSFYYARIHHSRMADIMDNLPPGTKYFIFQFIEVTLPNFLDPDFTTHDDPQ